MDKFLLYWMIVQKFWVCICSPRLHLFDLKYSKNSNIVKYYYNKTTVFFTSMHLNNYADLMLKKHVLLFLVKKNCICLKYNYFVKC